MFRHASGDPIYKPKKFSVRHRGILRFMEKRLWYPRIAESYFFESQWGADDKSLIFLKPSLPKTKRNISRVEKNT
jgi:hypothetical protein